MKIYKNLDELDRDLDNISFGEFYLKDENLKVRIYQDSFRVTELKNSLKAGKTCRRIGVSMTSAYNQRILYEIKKGIRTIGISFKYFIQLLLQERALLGSTFEEMTTLKAEFWEDELKAIRVFSPFAESKPMKEPKKWSLPAVIKGIRSGQIRNGACTLYLTDDYKDDAARNFRRGAIDLLELAKRLVESPSGWSASVERKEGKGTILSVSCSGFNYNRMEFRENWEEVIDKETTEPEKDEAAQRPQPSDCKRNETNTTTIPYIIQVEQKYIQ